VRLARYGGRSSSTNGGSAYKQSDNNPLKQLGDWFGGAKKGVEDKAKQAGQCIYDHSSEISAIAGTAAVVTAFIPGVDAISPALFAVSAVTGVMAAHKDMRQGNYGSAALDMMSVIPGGGAAGAFLKDARLAVNVGKDAKGALGFVKAARGGVGPVMKGQAGVEKSIAAAQARGDSILGREITFDTSGGRVRPDFVAQRPSGDIYAVDAKNGPGAGLTPNQETGYPALRTEGGIPRGANAERAGLTVGVQMDAFDVLIEHW
jgi:hypothetical protein